MNSKHAAARPKPFRTVGSNRLHLLLWLLTMFAWTWLWRLQAAPEANWTAHDIVQAEQLGDVEVSPIDPSVVVWVKLAPNKEKDEMVSHLFRSTAQGGPLQLTRGKVSCASPRFSPDGTRIAFLSARELPKADKEETSGADSEPKSQILLLEGGEPFALTEFARGIQAFAWRDTNHIVFTAQEPPTGRELSLKEKKDKSVVVEDEENEPPVRLFEVELASRKVTRRTTNADRISAFFIAPDAQWAVTVHEQSLRFKYDDQIRPHYYLMDFRTGERTRILEERRFVLSTVVWMPDSSGFYALNRFTSHPKYLDAFVTELWQFAVADRKSTLIPLDWPAGVAGIAGPESALVALPDGFLTLLAEGARQKPARYTRTGEAWRRAFLVGSSNILSFHASRLVGAGALAVTQTSANQPPQLSLAKLEGADLKITKPVTELNPSWKDKPKARAEIIHWPGAKEEQIEGVLYHPLKAAASGPRPLVLMIHGGPFGASSDTWSQGWSTPIQLHSQRGLLSSASIITEAPGTGWSSPNPSAAVNSITICRWKTSSVEWMTWSGAGWWIARK